THISCAPLTVVLRFVPLTPLPPTSPLFPYTTLFRSTPARTPRRAGPGRRSWPGPAGSGSWPWSTGDLVSRSGRASRTGRGHHGRSEEHTSELQSRFDLVCRLLLEK